MKIISVVIFLKYIILTTYGYEIIQKTQYIVFRFMFVGKNVNVLQYHLCKGAIRWQAHYQLPSM